MIRKKRLVKTPRPQDDAAADRGRSHTFANGADADRSGLGRWGRGDTECLACCERNRPQCSRTLTPGHGAASAAFNFTARVGCGPAPSECTTRNLMSTLEPIRFSLCVRHRPTSLTDETTVSSLTAAAVAPSSCGSHRSQRPPSSSNPRRIPQSARVQTSLPLQSSHPRSAPRPHCPRS